jgi:hypothetical protein
MPIERGEIYFVSLNPVQGREQAGPGPVLVLSIAAINKLPLVVTVVVGTKGENISLIILRMYVLLRRIVACQGKWCSYAFRFARWMRSGFPITLQGS